MLGDDLAAALPELRAHAESRMRSTARFETVVLDFDTDGTPIETVVDSFEVKCRVKARETAVSVAGINSPQTIRADEIHVPVHETRVREGMRVTITASPLARLVGSQWRVERLHAGDDTTAQRLGVETWQPLISPN